MEGLGAGLGAGLAALAFWGFVAALIVASIWYGAKERQARHETLRRMVESGKPVDQALMDKVLGESKRKRPDRDLRIGAIVIFSVAVGLVVLGLFVSTADSRALMPILGAAGLLLCIGIGLMVASAYVRKWQAEDDDLDRSSPRSR